MSNTYRRPVSRRLLANSLLDVKNQLAELGATTSTAGGKTFYVNSSITGATDTTNFGQSVGRPFATLVFALAQCVSANGDTIILGQGHSEVVNVAAWATLSKNGVTILGQGTGNSRPTFQWTTTASQIVISGSSILWKNCIFDFTGIDAVVAGFSVTGDDVWFDNNTFVLATATRSVARGILSASTSARFKFENNLCFGPATTSGGTLVAVVELAGGASTDYIFRGNIFSGKMTQAISILGDPLRGNIDNNRFVIATGTKAIALSSGATGFISSNRINVAGGGSAPIVAAAGFVAGNIYSSAAGVTAGTASTI